MKDVQKRKQQQQQQTTTATTPVDQDAALMERLRKLKEDRKGLWSIVSLY